MAAYAFSVVKELQDDGTVKVYQPGDKLEGLGKDRVEHLLAVGAAATYDRTKSTGEQVEDANKEQDALRARVKELEEQLQQATRAQAQSEQKAQSEAQKASQASKSASSK